MSLTEIRDWLIAPDVPFEGPDDLIGALAARLVAAGVPLWRMSSSIPTLHPEIAVRNVAWDRKEGLKITLRQHSVIDSPVYRGSAVERIHKEERAQRCRSWIAEERNRFNAVRELFDQGATEYWIGPVRLGRRVGDDKAAFARLTFLSVATDAAGGFTDEHIRAFEALAPILGLQLAADSARYATASLLRVYLGQNAAQQVLAGGFKRGSGQLIRSALWFADMRGFTELSDRLGPREVVSVLDAYFERVGGAIEDAGGEILKFIGDAVLAVFPVAGDPATACRQALLAGENALKSLDTLNAERNLKLEMGVALHLGEVMYGNIGAHQRLDFTVIGAAVNEAARVESLCKQLGAPLLITGAFADAIGRDGLRSLGAQALRGVSGTREVFTVA